MGAWVDLPRLLPEGTGRIERGLERIVNEGRTGNETEIAAEGTNPRGDIPSMVGGSFDAAYDVAIEQPAYAEDSADLIGPSIGDLGDAAVTTQGENTTDDLKWRLIAGFVAVVLALAALAPYANLAASAADEEGA